MTPSFLQRLGLRHALIQAPMAGVQDAALAVAVSRAGALGSLPAAMLDANGLDRELELLGRELGPEGLPYNVNFFCHHPPSEAALAVQEAAWRRELAPYYAECGLNPSDIPQTPLRQPFSAELADVLERHRPAVVSFHFGLPAPELLDRVKAWGAAVLSSATTVDEAVWLEAREVDAVIVQGMEAGGHRGHFLRDDLSSQQPLQPLLAAVRAVVRTPLVAAGGVADAAGVRSALAEGAAAVQVGTAFLLCGEARTSAVHRAALQASQGDPNATALTNLFSGRPARGLVNRLMRERGPMGSTVPPFPTASTALAPLRRWAEARGLGDFSPLWAGQALQGCNEIPAARQVAALMGLPADT